MNAEILKIGVIAVGEVGVSIVSKLSAVLPHLARFIAIDINKEVLSRSTANIKILVDDRTTRPICADLERFLAQPFKAQIEEAVKGLDVVFLVAGLGDESSDDCLISVADMLRDMPEVLLTIGVPITFLTLGGPGPQPSAPIALKALTNSVHCLIPLTNEALAKPFLADGAMSSVLDEGLVILRDLYTGITMTLCEDGFIGVDFDDIRTVFEGHQMIMSVSTGYDSSNVRNALEGALLKIGNGHSSRGQVRSAWIVVEGSVDMKLHILSEIKKIFKNYFADYENVGLSAFIHCFSRGCNKLTLFIGDKNARH